MRYIKIYEDFDKNEEDLWFNFLANVKLIENCIYKVVELHEKKYYNSNKISKNSEFISDIKKSLQNQIDSKEPYLESILEIIKDYEKFEYKLDKFHLLETIDESIFSTLEDIYSPFSLFLYSYNEKLSKDTSDELSLYVDEMVDSANKIINSMDSSWIYQKSEEEEKEDLLKHGDFPFSDFDLN